MVGSPQVLLMRVMKYHLLSVLWEACETPPPLYHLVKVCPSLPIHFQPYVQDCHPHFYNIFIGP